MTSEIVSEEIVKKFQPKNMIKFSLFLRFTLTKLLYIACS